MSEDIAGATTNTPLARDTSLSAFFKELGIANFICGDQDGFYGLDWGHIPLEELDNIVQRNSATSFSTDGYRLEHTTRQPEHTIVRIGPSTTYRTSFGEIEPPWFTAKDGATYVFLKATFRDSHFSLMTRIEQTGVAPIEDEYTVEELRRMIGSLPPKPGAWKRLLRIITSLFQ